MTKEAQDAPYRVKELAARLRVHPTTIQRLIKLGRIPAFRIGRAFLIPRDEFDALLREKLAGVK